MTRTMKTLLLTAGLALLASPAWAATPKPRLGEPRIIAAFDGPARVVESASGAAHRAFVVVEPLDSGGRRHVVMFRAADGRYRRFDLPPPREPIRQVRLALLEGGDGFAAWDDGDRIAVQRWWANGGIDRPVAALEGIRPATAADSAVPNWGMGFDGVGTVVLTALRPGRGARVDVRAAIREPGAAVFGPAATVAALRVADVAITPPVVERGGAVTVRWYNGAARRPAAGAPFAAPVTSTWETDPGHEPTGPDAVAVADLSAETMRRLPSGTNRVTLVGVAATGGPVDIGPALRNLCRMGAQGCARPQRFIWANGRERLAVLVSAPAPARSWTWHVAEPKRDGSFIRPRVVSVNPGLAPLWGATPGRVDFAGVDTDGVPGAQRDGGRVFVVPYGTGPAIADRRRPSVSFAERGTSRARAVLLPVWCNETCTLRVRVRVERQGRKPGRWQPAAALDTEGSYAVGMEPFQAASVRIRTRPAAGMRLRLRVVARDRVGKTRTARVVLRAVTGPDAALVWCASTSRSCR